MINELETALHHPLLWLGILGMGLSACSQKTEASVPEAFYMLERNQLRVSLEDRSANDAYNWLVKKGHTTNSQCFPDLVDANLTQLRVDPNDSNRFIVDPLRTLNLPASCVEIEPVTLELAPTLPTITEDILSPSPDPLRTPAGIIGSVACLLGVTGILGLAFKRARNEESPRRLQMSLRGLADAAQDAITDFGTSQPNTENVNELTQTAQTGARNHLPNEYLSREISIADALKIAVQVAIDRVLNKPNRIDHRIQAKGKFKD